RAADPESDSDPESSFRPLPRKRWSPHLLDTSGGLDLFTEVRATWELLQRNRHLPRSKQARLPSRSRQNARPPATATCGHADAAKIRSRTASSVYFFVERSAVSTRASFPF